MCSTGGSFHGLLPVSLITGTNLCCSSHYWVAACSVCIASQHGNARMRAEQCRAHTPATCGSMWSCALLSQQAGMWRGVTQRRKKAEGDVDWTAPRTAPRVGTAAACPAANLAPSAAPGRPWLDQQRMRVARLSVTLSMSWIVRNNASQRAHRILVRSWRSVDTDASASAGSPTLGRSAREQALRSSACGARREGSQERVSLSLKS